MGVDDGCVTGCTNESGGAVVYAGPGDTHNSLRFCGQSIVWWLLSTAGLQPLRRRVTFMARGSPFCTSMLSMTPLPNLLRCWKNSTTSFFNT